MQPWDPLPEDPSLDLQRERDRLLAALATSELGTVEARVARILQRYPETRDSDTELAIRYWYEFEPDVAARVDDVRLAVLHDLQPMGTIVRCRQRIQNDLSLFVGTRRTRALRDERQLEFYRYLAERRDSDAELCFYLDETGSDTTGRFVGLGGVCVLDSRLFEMHYASLRLWRERQDWPETLHFADMDSTTEKRFLTLLAALRRHRTGLMFVGYATLARGNKSQILASLFVQLIGDALKHAESNGCLGTIRAVRIVKEAQEGFDSVQLPALEQDLSQHLLQLFPNRVYLKCIEPLPKGREVLLECADVIASAMKRRWESGHSIHKDRVAEAVMNVTGFEDRRDGTPFYRMHTA